jgi:secondary thiamine-phosphate synthase enzyme
MWIQKEIHLKSRDRGFHLITEELLHELPELRNVRIGMVNLFILHTSASLSINENADPSVRQDFENYFNKAVAEGHYLHRNEGSDDLPAHIKCSLLGNSLNIPITNGSFRLGSWQGIYLGEHRNQGGTRRLIATIQGE